LPITGKIGAEVSNAPERLSHHRWGSVGGAPRPLLY
jgi:hypothetical protein